MIEEYFDAQGYTTKELSSFMTQTALFDAAEGFHEKIYLDRLKSIDDIRASFRDYCAERNYNDVEQKLLAEAMVEYYNLEAVTMFME